MVGPEGSKGGFLRIRGSIYTSPPYSYCGRNVVVYFQRHTLDRWENQSVLRGQAYDALELQKATWFWSEDVQAAIREKKSKYKLWWRTRQPEDRDAYLAAKRETK
ncbi:hypothetical protein RB195_010653 [Necator americanus]|uniref:Nudix hydrolase domain-containing protein n=1 Tax=Necator americanus TaxID=51031 RepID=A0ABR1CZ01_NECAM